MLPTRTLIQLDALSALACLDNDEVHSVVTDPPYGLSQHSQKDVTTCLQAWLAGEPYLTKKRGFMGRSWDAWVPGPELWREVYRVLKPGGHCAVFAGSRTMDLMAIALRLAGFEYRDTVMWVYGAGFPKSHDVGKQIDKSVGAVREVVGVDPARAGRLVNQRGKYETDAGWSAGSRSADITAPATDDAKRWDGYGTAIKPAFEPILLFRKPLEGTVVENVLKHGTGALNIDACRIVVSSGDKKTKFPVGDYGPRGLYGKDGERTDDPSPGGRWPANVVLDEEAAAALDQQTGNRPGCRSPSFATPPSKFRPEQGKYMPQGPIYGDSGGASRFFYTSKSSGKDRHLCADGKIRLEIVNDHATVKPTDLMRWISKLVTPRGGTILDPFTGSGSTGVAAALEGFSFFGVEQDEKSFRIAESRLLLNKKR